MSNNSILIRHSHIEVPTGNSTADNASIATVMMNLSYYGYSLNVEAHKAMTKLDSQSLTDWWQEVDQTLKSLTGDDKNIGDFVVYKNFPKEVLDKSEAEYWIPQLLMYWGFDKSYFTEPVAPRANMSEQKTPKVLHLANSSSLKKIFESRLASAAKWKDEEFQEVTELATKYNTRVDLIKFKENLVRLVKYLMDNGHSIDMETATDVLRLAAGMSNTDISLKEKPKFRSFKKPERRFLLSMLEKCGNISEDFARRPEIWKKFLHHMHPGDWAKQFPRVCEAMNSLYHDNLTTFNSQVEQLLLKHDESVLNLLATRPGDYRRRLAHTLTMFGAKSVKVFLSDKVLNRLTVAQIVSLRSHLTTINKRNNRVFPPKGNWNKLKVNDSPRWVENGYVKELSTKLGEALSKRVAKVKVLDEATKLIKLPSGGEVGPYSRGTSFKIPNGIDFIRTASYWKSQGHGTVWFDNGWNFFDKNWKDQGSCCWTDVNFKNGAAVFSGDPVNSGEMKGRAAQLIDLYPAKLVKAGVRYAVWNVLCFSNVPFSDAEDVFAALQWGENAQSGKLFEPSRCQLSFPLKSKQLTKYVCLIDLETNEMIYLDANLAGQVHSAERNGAKLEELMPAFMEYISALPSVYDLFKESISEDSKIQILYSDKDITLDGDPAYVFQPQNEANKFNPIDLNKFLG